MREQLSGVPVVAFHSYKGGVGRTLSAIAFAKAWSSLAPNQRLLIVDSDLEAPGLTWLWEEKGEMTFSYLDLLEVIQSYESAEEISGVVSDKISKMTFSIETDKMLVEHFFCLPIDMWNNYWMCMQILKVLQKVMAENI